MSSWLRWLMMVTWAWKTWLTVGLRLNALEQMLQQISCFALKTGGESLHRPRQISSR